MNVLCEIILTHSLEGKKLARISHHEDMKCKENFLKLPKSIINNVRC